MFLLFGFSKLFFWSLTTFLHYQERDGWFAKDLALEGFLSFGAAVLAAWIMSKIERRAFKEYGLTRTGVFGQHFWAGLVWGLGASVLMIVLLRVLGIARVEGLALHGGELVSSALLWGLAFLLLGFAEEFAYRGYAQATLAQGMGFGPLRFCCR